MSGGATARGSQAVFKKNTAASQLAGGAIFGSSGADIILTDSALTANTASPHPEDGGLYGAGAAYTQQAHLRLIDTAVQDNTATGGDTITASNFADSLYIQTPLTIKVKDSSFAPLLWGGKTVTINPRIANPGEVTQGGCKQHPCAVGSSCSYANYSLSCQDCPDQTVGQDGIACSMVKDPQTRHTLFLFMLVVFSYWFGVLSARIGLAGSLVPTRNGTECRCHQLRRLRRQHCLHVRGLPGVHSGARFK